MIGQTLNNRYTVSARIGSGAMGTVYRATDSQTAQDVAIKVISRELSLNPEMIERFRREGEALQQLRHPNIVSFIDAFQHEEQYMIVMEYVSGGSLHSLIQQGPLPIDRVRRIALELCDALTRAHHLNIIHRDIKPENVLLADDGTPKLTDFGVAKLLNEATRLTGTGMQVGTPYYMSPEAWEGRPLDAQADIWSLGIVIYEMLAGEVPFGGDTAAAVMTKVLMSPPLDLRQLRSEAPEGLEQVIIGMLQRDKTKRYQTMREVAADLEKGHPTIPLKPVAKRKSSELWKAMPRWLSYALGIVAILVILIGAAIWLPRGEIKPSVTSTQLIIGAVNQAATETRAAAMVESDKGTRSAVETIVALTPTKTPAPTSTLSPIDAGEILNSCSGNDLCIYQRGKNSRLGLSSTYSIRSGSGSWSSDGLEIAFSGCLLSDIGGDPARCEYRQNLFITSRDGKQIKPVLIGAGINAIDPVWSPDGKLIAIHQMGSLTIIQPDGKGLKKLADNAGTCPFGIAWSPDSLRLAWIGGICGTGADRQDTVWVINRDGTAINAIYKSNDTDLAYGQIAWSPDGKSVAAAMESGVVYLIDANCSNKPNGCDDTSRTTINKIPEHWMNNFCPQWAGEKVAR